MHTKQDRSNKQCQHPSFSLQMLWKHLLTNYSLHAYKAIYLKQATSISIIFIANILEISTYILFCAYIQSKTGQTSNVSIHYIHCKCPGNIYLRPILCMHTKRVGS